MSDICYTLGEPGGVASTGTGSNHLLPLEGKHMANDKAIRFMVPRQWTLAQRIAHYSEPVENGCRLWKAGLNRLGYGNLWWNGLTQSAHRLAWVAANGPIPAGLHVCHKCDVRACVNPDHLFLGTAADNNADRAAKGRSHHPLGERQGGHKLTEADVREIRASKGSQREIAAKYGVSQSLISMIKLRQTWSHLEDSECP